MVLSIFENYRNVFCFKITRKSYYEAWRLRCRITADTPNKPTSGIFTTWDIDYYGYQNDLKAQYVKVNHGTYCALTSMLTLYPIDTTDNVCYFGFAGGSSTNNQYANPEYARTVVVDLLDYENCEVEMLDDLLWWKDMTQADYASRYVTLTTSGYQETGDSNTAPTFFMRYSNISRPTLLYNSIHCLNGIAADGIHIVPIHNGPSGTGNTKTAQTTYGIRTDELLYYRYSATAVEAETSCEGKILYTQRAIDLRYNMNKATTHKYAIYSKLYLVGSIGQDGLFYVDSADPWIVNDRADTSKVYWEFGQMQAAGTNGYSAEIHEDQTIWKYDNALQKWVDLKIYQQTHTYLTPEMFGAVGDGVTDDTTAIQTAINRAKQCNIGKVVCLSKNYLVRHQRVIAGDNDDSGYEITDYRHNRPGTADFSYCIYVDSDVTLDLNGATITCDEDATPVVLCGNSHLINGTVAASGGQTYTSPIVLIHGGVDIHGAVYGEEFTALNGLSLEDIRIIDTYIDGYTGQCSDRTGLLLYAGGAHKSNHVQMCRVRNVTVSNTYYGIRLFASDKNKNAQGYFVNGNMFSHVALNNNAVAIACEGNSDQFTSVCSGNLFTDVVFQAQGNDQKTFVFLSHATMCHLTGEWYDMPSAGTIHYLDETTSNNLLQFTDNIKITGTDLGSNNVVLQTSMFKALQTSMFDNLYATHPYTKHPFAVGLQDHHLWRGVNYVSSYTSSAGNTYDFSTLFNPLNGGSISIAANDTVELIVKLPDYQWNYVALEFENVPRKTIDLYCRKRDSSDEWEQLLHASDNYKNLYASKINYDKYNTCELKIVIQNGSTVLYFYKIFATSNYVSARSNGTWMPRLLMSPDGSYFALKVANDGSLSTQRVV